MYPEISQRELLEVADRLLTHEALVEKLGFFEHHTQDTELQQLLHRHRQMYLRHCSEMASLIHTVQRRTGWQAYHRPLEPYTTRWNGNGWSPREANGRGAAQDGRSRHL